MKNKFGAKLSTAWAVLEHSPDQLKAALTEGPVIFTANTDQPFWRDYSGGIIDNQECTDEIGHVLLAIGFGTDPEKGDYLTFKNSWGTSWGERGFGRISLTQKYSPQGLCGILWEPFLGEVE